jgi:outer membrane protein OmpA-like peptidoglycan-associated protein
MEINFWVRTAKNNKKITNFQHFYMTTMQIATLNFFLQTLAMNLLFSATVFCQDYRVYEFSKLPVKVVNCVAVDFQNTKWIATEQGIYTLSGDNLQLRLPPDTKTLATNVVTIDEEGRKWIGTYNSQVYCLTGNNDWKYLTFRDFGDNVVSGLDIDNKQNLWVALYEKGIVRQDSKGENTFYDTENSNLGSTRIFALFADKSNNIWAGTEKGLYCFESEGKKWKKEKPDGQINAIAEYDGALWITMLTNEGTEFWKYENFKNWQQQALPAEIAKDRIKEIAFDAEGKCWLAASKIACLAQGNWLFYGKEQGFLSEAALDIATDLKGDIWVGTEGKGLFKVSKEKAQVVAQINEPLFAEPELANNKPLSLADLSKITNQVLNKSIKLNIAFEQSKAVLTPSSLAELDKLAKLLAENSALLLEIAGHTDNIGNPVANQRLSEERSHAVKTYLVMQQKIKAERIFCVGYGGTKPIADNRNEKTRPFNRRVEIVLYKK